MGSDRHGVGLMSDLATRISTRHSGLLRVDEQVAGAWSALPVGHLRQPMVYAAHGPLLGAVLGRLIGGSRRRESDGLAARLSGASACVVVETDQRWLALGRHPISGSPTHVVAEWSVSDVAEVSARSTRVASHLRLSFIDESELVFEAIRGHAFARVSAAT